MPDLAQHFTEQFIRWEVRGRGWTLYDEPVELEPPFRPFNGYTKPRGAVVDDGRRETFLSKLFSPKRTPEPQPEPDDEAEETVPESAGLDRDLVEFRLVLPPKLVVSQEAFGRFLTALGQTREPVAMELVGSAHEVVAQLTTGEGDAFAVERQLRAHFPEAVITRHGNRLLETFQDSATGAVAVFEFGLQHEFLLPLATFRSLDADPLIGVAGVLGGLEPGELAVYQVLFQPTRHDWAEHALRTVVGFDGRPVFVNAEELAKGAEAKLTGPLFATVVRLGVLTEGEDRLDELLGGLENALNLFGAPTGNQLIALANDDLDPVEHLRDLLLRRSHRTGMLLNRDELVGLAHPPSASLREPKLVRSIRVTRAAPERLTHEAFKLGVNEHEGVEREVGLSDEDRVRHLHLLGGTGMGKSTLLLNCMSQDLRAGRGFALLDPAGDLVDRVLACVPPERRQDVILFDPTDEDWPVGFNVLTAHSELERTLLASDLTASFRRQATTWGDVMNAVLANAILAFLESDRGGTLADLRRFLVEPGFRKQFLSSVTDPEIRYYWEKQHPTISGKPEASIVTRLDSFLRPKAIRHMVCQRDSSLDFASLMDSGKVFLAKLPKGLLGEENAHLFASLLVGKFQQTAMARQAQAVSARRDFFLYLDEFADIRTPSVIPILTGARKYRVGLVLAHQDLRQLQVGDDQILGAVQACQVRVCFKLGEDDARRVAEGFAGFDAKDFTNLAVGEAIAKVGPRDASFNLRVPWEEPAHEADWELTLSEVRDNTRCLYARPRAQVAAEYAEAIGLVTVPAAGGVPEAKAPVEALPSVAPSAPPAESLPIDQDKPLPEPVGSPTPPVLPSPQEEPRPPQPEAGPEPSEPFTTPTPEPVLVSNDHKAGAIKQRLIQGAVPLGYSYREEQPVLGGTGRVDLVFSRGQLEIACEICGTTNAEHEVGNLQKCLVAGFQHIVSVCDPTAKRHRIGELLKAQVPREQLAKVRFCTAPQTVEWLKRLSEVGSVPHRSEGSPFTREELAAMNPEEQARAFTKVLAELKRKRDDTRRRKEK